jgi:hypothetical protein
VRLMVRTYFTLLAVCTGLTLFFAIPSVAILAVVFTLGLALPLLFALPMVTILLWSLLPAVLARKSWLRWPALALGLALPASLLLLPGMADREAARLLATRSSVAPQSLTLSGPFGVEIIRTARHAPDLWNVDGVRSDFYGEAPCFDLCERLLTGGEVSWVRIVIRDDAFSNDKAVTSARFIRATDAACHAANADFPETGATCIHFAPDDGQAAALVLDLNDDRVWRDRARTEWPLEEIGYRTATAHAGSSPEAPVVFRAVQLFFARPNGLVSVNAGNLGAGKPGGGFALSRSRSATPPIDLAAAVTALGFSLGPIREPLPKTPGTESNVFIASPPDAQDAAYVASLLALGAAPDPRGRSNAFAQVVNGWHQRLRWKKPITAADRAIFCASLRDTSIPMFFWADQLRNKGLTCE